MCNNNVEEFDPIYNYVGKLVVVENNGKKFCAKVIAIKGEELWFQGKNSAIWMIARSNVKYIGLAKIQVA